MLGFGASGKELAEKWDIKYLGPETMDGVKTEKLELVAKDPTVRKNLPKVTVWMDTERGVSLKQVFDEGQGQSRICTYFNIKVNQPSCRRDAFTLQDATSRHEFVNPVERRRRPAQTAWGSTRGCSASRGLRR